MVSSPILLKIRRRQRLTGCGQQSTLPKSSQVITQVMTSDPSGSFLLEHCGPNNSIDKFSRGQGAISAAGLKAETSVPTLRDEATRSLHMSSASDSVSTQTSIELKSVQGVSPYLQMSENLGGGSLAHRTW